MSFVVYNKKHIWPLSQVPDTEHLTPLQFPEWQVSFIIHNKPHLKITPEFILTRWLRVGSLGKLKVGMITRKARWLEIETFCPTHNPIGKRVGLETDFCKNSWTGAWMEFQMGECMRGLAGRMEHQRGRRGSMSCQPPYLAIFISSIWLFLSCTLYNKLVIVNEVFFCVP